MSLFAASPFPLSPLLRDLSPPLHPLLSARDSRVFPGGIFTQEPRTGQAIYLRDFALFSVFSFSLYFLDPFLLAYLSL